MKTKTWIAVLAAVACTGSVFAKGEAAGEKKQDQIQKRVQLKTCTPTLEQEQVQDKECLSDEVKAAVNDMTKAREEYEKKLAEQKALQEECTEEKREQLRQQQDEQAQKRERVRERLREMRKQLQDHSEVMDAAKEQVQEQRRGAE